MKHKEIIDSLSHMLYVKFSNHNPGFALVQLPCSQMVPTSLQEHGAFLGSCGFFAEPVFTASQNIQQACLHPPPFHL